MFILKIKLIFVQRLRSEPWTYKLKILFLSFFHSVSNFLSFALVNTLVSGSGSGIQPIQDIVTSNAGAWLSNAILRLFMVAEQCRTKKQFSGVSN